MANRSTSLLLQLGTVAGLSGAWLWARATKSKKQCEDHRSSYCIRPKRYAALSTLLLLADIYAIPAILRGKGLIDKEELAEITGDTVRGFDRHALSFVGSKHRHYQDLSDNLLKALVGLPLLLLLDKRIRHAWQEVLALYAWTHALTYTIYSFSPLGPAFVDKYRPIVYYADLPEAIRNLGNNRNARFSGHTANGACAAFFMAKVYNDFYPSQDSAAKYGRYLLAYTAPILLGWLRTKALKHFPSDVLQAIVVGGTCGIMVPELYRR
jgi:hypothetical protein